MKNISLLQGKRVAVVLYFSKSNWENEDDEEACVCTGTAAFNNDQLTIALQANPQFEILPDWQERINPVPEDLKKILLNADYYFPLRVGNMPDNASPEDFIKRSSPTFSVNWIIYGHKTSSIF